MSSLVLHRGNSEDGVAARVRTFERHLAEHEIDDVMTVPRSRPG
jgi:hypothetical protein